jgi:GTP-binding protein EngB required for normal cell division
VKGLTTTTARTGDQAPGDSRNLAARLEELSQLELLPSSRRQVVEEAARKLANAAVYVAVVGDFKRGKSSLINALLGARLLPVGVLPLTSQPTLIRYGPEPCAVVRLESGTERISVQDLAKYVTEKSNPGNRLKVEEAWVEYPSELLREGVVVVDTPGTGSVHQHNTDAAHAFLPRIDVAVAVLTAESPLSLSESQWFREVAGRAARLVICLNKVDVISTAEREEATEYVQLGVSRLLGTSAPTIFATSARRELESGADQGVAALREWLRAELGQSRSTIAWESAARTGRSALELAHTALALERAALATPASAARDRAARMEASLARLAKVGRDGRALITAHAADLVGRSVEPQVDLIRSDLHQRLLALADVCDWSQELEATAYHSGLILESVVREPLRQALLDQAERLQSVLDEFVSDVGTTYQITLPDPPRLADRARLPTVRITTSDEPGALAVGLRSVRRTLPGVVGRSWRERAHRQDAEESADRLAGRLRYATVSAVDEAVREWLVWADGQWRALADALSAASRRSADAAADGEAAARSQERRLSQLDGVLASVGEALRPRSDPPGDLHVAS